jgi:PAS domain S-box-containing protein
MQTSARHPNPSYGDEGGGAETEPGGAAWVSVDASIRIVRISRSFQAWMLALYGLLYEEGQEFWSHPSSYYAPLHRLTLTYSLEGEPILRRICQEQDPQGNTLQLSYTYKSFQEDGRRYISIALQPLYRTPQSLGATSTPQSLTPTLGLLPYMVLNLRGVIQEMSPAMTRFLGYAAEEHLGRHLLASVGNQDTEGFQERLQSAAYEAEPQVQEFTLRMLHRNGAVIPYRFYLMKLFSPMQPYLLAIPYPAAMQYQYSAVEAGNPSHAAPPAPLAGGAQADPLASQLPPHLFIRREEGFQRLWTEDITWIEAFGDYIKIYTGETRYTILGRMKDLEQQLACDPAIMRVHRSYLVNLRKVDRIEENTLIVGGKALVPMGRKYYGPVMQRLNIF